MRGSRVHVYFGTFLPSDPRNRVTGRGDRPDRSTDEHTKVCISMQPGKLFNGRPTVSPAGVICTSDHAFRGEDFHAIWEYSEGCGKTAGPA